jgi:hypothetical protein
MFLHVVLFSLVFNGLTVFSTVKFGRHDVASHGSLVRTWSPVILEHGSFSFCLFVGSLLDLFFLLSNDKRTVLDPESWMCKGTSLYTIV